MKKPILPKHMRDFNHRLVTRRDFLAAGILSFGAISAVHLTPAWAHAAAAGMCGGDMGTAGLPFVAFDMAGGGSLPGNFLVGKRGGPSDMLKSYDLLGWNPRESGALNTDFGLPMSAKYSQILQGILQNASAGARANLRMGSFCHQATFDTSSNQLNAGTLVLRSGTRGSYITNGCGSQDSLTGGNSQGPQTSPLYKPVTVNSVNDLVSATNYGGAAFQGMEPEKMTALAQGGVDLGAIQKQDYAGSPGGGALSDASVCAYAKSLDFLSGVQGLDPRQDDIAQAVYRIDQNTTPDDMQAVTAGLVMNSVRGYSGPATWTLGDCDYHTNSSADGDARDLQMGQQIGLALEFAFRAQRPFFFQLLTDGGNTAEGGSRNWSSDSSEAAMTVIGYFDPKGPVDVQRVQIGQYTDGQGADASSLIGNDPALVAYAVFANYLNLLGRIGEFANFAPGIFTGKGELDSVLIFHPKGA
jgi:hypothetical protein